MSTSRRSHRLVGRENQSEIARQMGSAPRNIPKAVLWVMSLGAMGSEVIRALCVGSVDKSSLCLDNKKGQMDFIHCTDTSIKHTYAQTAAQ